MPFKTTYFKTRTQAIAFFNKVSRHHIAFFCKDNECNQYFVANEQDFRFINKSST